MKHVKMLPGFNLNKCNYVNRQRDGLVYKQAFQWAKMLSMKIVFLLMDLID